MSSSILSICIVSYNTRDLTLDAIKSSVRDIQKSSLLKNKSEILVVDNNSSDDSVTVINHFKKTSPVPITILENKENSGFGTC